MRYAQYKSGLKLHIVHTRDDEPELRAICGFTVPRWRMTINIPLNACCKRCAKARP